MGVALSFAGRPPGEESGRLASRRRLPAKESCRAACEGSTLAETRRRRGCPGRTSCLRPLPPGEQKRRVRESKGPPASRSVEFSEASVEEWSREGTARPRRLLRLVHADVVLHPMLRKPRRRRVLEEFERAYLEKALADSGGNVAAAAASSGIARRHFQRIRARQKYGAEPVAPRDIRGSRRREPARSPRADRRGEAASRSPSGRCGAARLARARRRPT